MLTTPNYGLKKVQKDDIIYASIPSYNLDIIDTQLALKALKTDIKVTSVNNKTGAVTLSKADVGLNNVNNWGVSNDINNNSETTYATANAVKQAYDKAEEALSVCQ